MFTRSSPLTSFPFYLLPPSPFRVQRKRTDSASSTETADSTNPSDDAQEYFGDRSSHLRCAKCATDVCLTSQIISKGFTGRHGRAYLVSPLPLSTRIPSSSKSSKQILLPNTKTDAPSSRQLVTGAHTVSDVRCAFCSSLLGWKYDEAEEEAQRYKVGKYILETKMICSSSNWEVADHLMPPVSLQTALFNDIGGDDSVEFDSQDEDECEDLFAGVWSSSLAAKRRQGRSFGGMMAGNVVETNSRH